MIRVAWRTALVGLLAGLALLALGSTPAGALSPKRPQPVFAYYYIWFQPSSWNRGKSDYPLLGRYSSDETSVMRRHIQLAKAAGIDGFNVSWKNTAPLNARMDKLVRVAAAEHFKLNVVYQGLDFNRDPLPASRVGADLRLFSSRWGRAKVFEAFGRRPVVILTGTWRFTRGELATILDPVRPTLRVLATERNARDYEEKADLFEGDAYYWGAANPETFPDYRGKLREMGRAVHAHGGLWIAPAAPGFNARGVGGTSLVPRRGGRTLRTQLDAAMRSSPDAVGLISWNEFSENTQVEPSQKLGTSALKVVADVLGAHFVVRDDLDSSSATSPQASGLRAIPALIAFFVLSGLAIVLLRRRGDRRAGGQRSGRAVDEY